VGGVETAVWIASTDNHSKPDVSRPIGVVGGNSADELLIYLPKENAGTLLKNVEQNDRLALFCSNVTTFESYQFKGRCTMQRLADDGELESQKRVLGRFVDVLSEIFALPGQKLMDAYYSIPVVVLTVRVAEIFDQTPRKGTGNPIEPAE
jgi:hypothetical protein